jgi:hypothetical protein
MGLGKLAVGSASHGEHFVLLVQTRFFFAKHTYACSPHSKTRRGQAQGFPPLRRAGRKQAKPLAAQNRPISAARSKKLKRQPEKKEHARVRKERKSPAWLEACSSTTGRSSWDATNFRFDFGRASMHRKKTREGLADRPK